MYRLGGWPVVSVISSVRRYIEVDAEAKLLFPEITVDWISAQAERAMTETTDAKDFAKVLAVFKHLAGCRKDNPLAFLPPRLTHETKTDVETESDNE